MVISLKSGTPVRSGGKEYTLQHILDGGTVVAMNVESGQREVLPIVSLQPTEGADRSKDLKTISDEDWDIARQRFAAIYPLISKKRPPQGAYLVQASKHNVHFGTIYHWRRCFLKDGLLNALLPQPRGPKAGEKVLDSVIEDVIAKTIKELYLSIQRPSMKKVYEEVLLRCRAAGLKAPHYNTIRHRIAELDKFSVAREREGLEVAEGRFKPNEGSLVADFPLATVQVDHTLLDITIVDEVSRLPIGRVWITVVFDVFSRMVLGFYLSLDPPGDISVGLALGRAILRKESWLAELKLDAEWDAFGIPSCLHMDNAKEFRGKMLKRACEKYGIGIDWRPVKKPRWGAHIERYMARFAEELKAIPGATFSNIAERGNYDSDRHACMTLRELEQYLIIYICKKYHQSIHSALGVSPAQMWRDGILGTKFAPGLGSMRMAVDSTEFWMDFLPFVERTIGKDGVRIDGVYYFHDVLRPFVNAVEPGRYHIPKKFLFRRDPRDISRVYFFDEANERYHEIPYRHTGRPPISIWELRAAKRHLKERGRETTDEGEIFAALAELKNIVTTSKSQTRKVRRNAERLRVHRERSGHGGKTTKPEVSIAASEIDCAVQLEAFDDVEIY